MDNSTFKGGQKLLPRNSEVLIIIFKSINLLFIFPIKQRQNIYLYCYQNTDIFVQFTPLNLKLSLISVFVTLLLNKAEGI